MDHEPPMSPPVPDGSSINVSRSGLMDVHVRFSSQVTGHPFLTRCADGSITLPELRRFLAQHGKYTRYFTRYLCALISQLDEDEDVLRLAANLVEELGQSVESRVPHSRIYADMLRYFDVRPSEHPVYPETQNLIDTMFMLCRRQGGIPGLGALCLGAEAIVPATYEKVIMGFRHHGVPAGALEFFTIHVECDDEHAKTMYEIIDRLTGSSRRHQVSVISAGEVAVAARLRFFDALLQEVQ
jgi:pyrroloquinoline quinone (PQQ) biosynthesis protein C